MVLFTQWASRFYAGAMFVHLPLLDVQHELYRVQRGPKRFETYIKLMTGPDNTLALPLTVPNPAAKAHVLGRLRTFSPSTPRPSLPTP